MAPLSAPPSPLSAEATAEALERAAPHPALRARILSEASADHRGGATATGVRWWFRYCTSGRNISPLQHVERDAPHADKLEAEVLFMDFTLWLYFEKPSGRALSVASISKYISQIHAYLEREHGCLATGGMDRVRLRALIKGLRRVYGQPPKRLRYGVRTQDLARAMAESLGGGSPLELMWRALLSVGFCGLMRGAELAVLDGTDFDEIQDLTLADITFGVDSGVFVVRTMMRPVKNAKILRGKTFALVLAGGGSLIDPVEALREHWAVAAAAVPESEWASTPLFSSGGQPLHVRDVRRMVKALMASIGADPRMFGAHSLRIGGATAALAGGVEPSVIRVCGRWSSDIAELYMRLTRQVASRCSVLIGSTPFDDIERDCFCDEELGPVRLEFHAEVGTGAATSGSDPDDFD